MADQEKKKKEGEKKKRKREREKKNHEYASRRPGHDRLPAFRTRLRGPRIVEVILYGEPRTRPLDADAVVPRACSCCNSPAARHRLIGPRYARIATAVASLYLLLLFSRLLPSFPPRERNKCTPTNAKISDIPSDIPSQLDIEETDKERFLFSFLEKKDKADQLRGKRKKKKNEGRRDGFVFFVLKVGQGEFKQRGRRQQVRGSSPRGRKETRNKYVAWQGGRVEDEEAACGGRSLRLESRTGTGTGRQSGQKDTYF